MIRPNEIEEEILLLLTEWINEAKEHKTYPKYVLDRITSRISSCWRNPDDRKVLCERQINDTKMMLIDEYETAGQYSELLKQKLVQIKDDLSEEVYNYYMRETESTIRIGFYLDNNRYISKLLVETGYDSLREHIEPNLEIEANKFITIVEQANLLYGQLTVWYNDFVSQINDQQLRDYLASEMRWDAMIQIDLNIKKDNPLEKIKEAILKNVQRRVEHSNEINDDIDDEETDTQQIETAVFYPKQESFYEKLEKWASELKNPDCSKWLSDYLTKGRELPFYKIKVFKYYDDIEKAKEYLISQYERFLQYKYEKEQYYRKKRERYSKICYKKDLQRCKEFNRERRKKRDS